MTRISNCDGNETKHIKRVTYQSVLMEKYSFMVICLKTLRALLYTICAGFPLRCAYNYKGRRQNSKDVVTNLPLKLATSGN